MMKMLSLLLLLAVLPAAGDPCTCGSCLIPHVQITGTCSSCDRGLPSASHKLCEACGKAKGVCLHCRKELGTLRTFIGTAAAVDKQPRADLEYFVCTPEEGQPQGIYRNRATTRDYAVGVRALFFASQGSGGDVHLRNVLPLAPKEKDLVLTGESEKPVHWMIGIISGPVVAPKDGKYRLTLPAVSGIPVEVYSDGKRLSRHGFDYGFWTQR